MDWVPLKKYHIDLIDREVNKIISIHRQLRESIIEGDILSVQKISDLELSIKKRIQDIDEFYNNNCLDDRVKFLQGPRMKLSRLISNSIISEKDKEFTLNIPINKKEQQSSSRKNKLSAKKNDTERKSEMRGGDTKRSNPPNQLSKSPLFKAANGKQKQKSSTFTKKPNITLQIPDQTPYENNYSFSPQKNNEKFTNKYEQPSNQLKKVNTTRKTQRLPVKAPTKQSYSRVNEPMKLNSSNQERWQQKNERSGYSQNQGAASPIGNTSQTSRSGVTNISARTKTLSSNNASSMKKLNDLIFTIKMTKEEYNDFMVIKKNLDRQTL